MIFYTQIDMRERERDRTRESERERKRYLMAAFVRLFGWYFWSDDIDDTFVPHVQNQLLQLIFMKSIEITLDEETRWLGEALNELLLNTL